MSDHEGQFVAKVGAVYRTVVLASYHEEKVAALEAELAKLRAGQEPVGYVMTEEQMGIGYDRRTGPVTWFGGYPKGGSYLYTTPQPSAVPDGWKLVPVEPTGAMTFVGQRHRHNSVWSIGAIYREMLAAAPAAPTTVQGDADLPPADCRQRLMADGKPYPKSNCKVCGQFSPKWRECDAAIAAARKGEGKV